MDAIQKGRRQKRVPVELHVQIIRGEDVQTYTCRDVSPGGLFVRTEETFRNGEPVEVRISLPGTQIPEKVAGVVVRVSTVEEGVGIRLVEKNRELERFFEEQAEDVLERSSKRILLVDPDPDARFFLRTILGIDGYRVTECFDLQEAWSQALTGEYELIVADPLVRNEEEQTFADHLAAAGCQAPVLFLVDGEMLGDDLPSSFSHTTVQKPVVLGPFRELVEQLVRGAD